MADLKDERRCTARAKGSGERCKRAAVVGGTVCAMHGGKAPQVAAAAQQRALEQAADQSLRKLWAGLESAPLVKDPVASLQRLAGALEQLVDEAGSRVESLKHVAGGSHLTQLRAEVVLFERALGHLRLLLVDMARLGLAERQVELQAGQAAIVVAAARAGLDALGSELLPGQRDAFLRVFLGALGRGPETVAGEVTA